jgi:hypothetical protein
MNEPHDASIAQGEPHEIPVYRTRAVRLGTDFRGKPNGVYHQPSVW